MQEVGEINIDFSIIETGNPKKLHIFDDSDWIYAENLPAYLVIVLPGSKKEKTFSFKKYAINTLNSHNLGLSCLKGDCTEEVYVDLPDGVYTITVKSGYENIESTKYYLKTDLFDLKKAEIVINNGIDTYDKELIDFITEINFLEDRAKAYTKEGDFVKANRYFLESTKKLEKYGCSNK